MRANNAAKYSLSALQDIEIHKKTLVCHTFSTNNAVRYSKRALLPKTQRESAQGRRREKFVGKCLGWCWSINIISTVDYCWYYCWYTNVVISSQRISILLRLLVFVWRRNIFLLGHLGTLCFCRGRKQKDQWKNLKRTIRWYIYVLYIVQRDDYCDTHQQHSAHTAYYEEGRWR